jgi:hypothetical protein
MIDPNDQGRIMQFSPVALSVDGGGAIHGEPMSFDAHAAAAADYQLDGIELDPAEVARVRQAETYAAERGLDFADVYRQLAGEQQTFELNRQVPVVHREAPGLPPLDIDEREKTADWRNADDLEEEDSFTELAHTDRRMRRREELLDEYELRVGPSYPGAQP